jgi:hypothetical protein
MEDYRSAANLGTAVPGTKEQVVIATPGTGFLTRYSVDEPGNLVLDNKRLTIRLWLSFGVKVSPLSISVAAGSVPISFAPEKRTDAEHAHPGTCVVGLRFELPLVACLPEIQNNKIALCFQVGGEPLLTLSLTVPPGVVAREIGKRWD